mgnify:CR=1 FL=1
MLDPDQFYIMASREAVRVPPTHAAEMVPFNPLCGEFTGQCAGFFDAGFVPPTGHAGGGREGCTPGKGPPYGGCFYFNARKAADGAHSLIVNQRLLMAALAIRHATGDYKRAMVLPPYKRVILDEAHHLEEVATSFISGKVTVRAGPGTVRPRNHHGSGGRCWYPYPRGR